MFDKGQFVIHPTHGAGIILAIDKEHLLPQFKTYYVIDPLLVEIILKIPVAKAEEIGLRLPLSFQELQEMLTSLGNLPPQPIKFPKIISLGPRLNCADPQSLIEIIKLLFYEKIYRQRQGKQLSITKRNLYYRGVTLLASELVAITNVSLEEAKIRVMKSLVYKETAAFSL